MTKLEHAPQRLSDLDLLDQARLDARWIASLVGKEHWATNEILLDLQERINTLEKKIRESSPAD